MRQRRYFKRLKEHAHVGGEKRKHFKRFKGTRLRETKGIQTWRDALRLMP
jgi:hypothetical protein